jgi:thymidylate synthase
MFSKNAIELVEKAFIPLLKKLDNNEIVAGTVELINAHLIFDPTDQYIDLGTVKKAPKKYIKKELDWYISKDLNIKGHVDDIEIWSKICSDNSKGHPGFVNSNYGWCVFSDENGEQNYSQFDFALKQLLEHPDGRQSVCFYSRPTMQFEWNDNYHAGHDFTCTFVTQHFIRNNKLEYIVYMRSNDSVFGLINDFSWHCFVYEQFMKDLKPGFKDLQYGNIHWNAGSLHIYERHWQLLRDVIKEYETI